MRDTWRLGFLLQEKITAPFPQAPYCIKPHPRPVTNLLLLTGDSEYGETSLPSSGLERFVVREY